MPRWLVLTVVVLLAVAGAAHPAQASEPLPRISPLAWGVAPREVVTGPDGNLWFLHRFDTLGLAPT